MGDQAAILPADRRFWWQTALERFVLLWERPLFASLFAGLIFLGIASLAGAPWRTSGYHFYNYLADSFLHGRLALRLVPAIVHDLSLYQGQYFLYWGPLPAILALPLVAIFGLQVSDVLQTITTVAMSAGLCGLLLRVIVTRGWAELSPIRRGLLVIFFTLGTAQTPLAALGAVWFLVQLQSIAIALLACIFAFSFKDGKAFFFTGCAVAGILLTRMSMVFIAVFLAWYLVREHRDVGLKRLAIYCMLGLLPIVLALVVTSTYNWLRFGNALESGISYHLMGEVFKENFARYGALSLHYIPLNFFLGMMYHPFISMGMGFKGAAGGSLFVLSPLFIASFQGFWKNRRNSDSYALLVSVVMGSIPALMVMAPGSIHFGPRYFLDFGIPLFLLTIRGIKSVTTGTIAFLVVLSVLQYLVGSWWMVNF